MGGQKILDILEATGAYLKKGHFKLVSGNHSDSYVHIRSALAYPEYASRIGKKLADEFKGERISVVAAFSVSGEPKNFKGLISAFLKNRGVLALRPVK